jgi:nanoRNase/pAp phosphatase (c-di-AMP/oligoRNAs hydrolase)
MTRKGRASKFPFVNPKKLSRAAVVCHRNADADAYLSAFAISRLLKSVAPKCRVDIVTPEGMTTLTAKLAERFRHRIASDTSSDYDLYVAVDVGDSELLKEWKMKMEASRAVKVLVDHHPLRDTGLYDHVLVDENATSAAEVVLRIFSELGKPVDKKTAQALLEGILFDSSHLSIAGEEALRGVTKLLDRGADLAQARRALRSEPDYGEVMAKLKGARRMKIYKLGNWVLGATLVGSFQAHVARALQMLGTDVSVVGGVSGGETRVSLRASQRFYEATKLRLGVDVAERVASELGGRGGGHPTAASFECGEAEEEAVTRVVQRIGTLLSLEPQEIG